MVSQPRAAVVMGMLEDMRMSQLREHTNIRKKDASMNGVLGRVKDLIARNF